MVSLKHVEMIFSVIIMLNYKHRIGLKLKTRCFCISLCLYDDVDERIGLMSATLLDSRKSPCCATLLSAAHP